MGGVVQTILKRVTKGKGGVAGIVITAGLTLVQSVLRKPGIQASLKVLIHKILPGGEDYNHYHRAVVKVAEEIVSLFKSRQFNPNRIAIDGVPGSGKSTLAAELADRLGMSVECLDHRNMDEPLLFDKDRTIYEHHRLLRTQDIDNFNVIIYIDEPVEISQKKVLQRKRGGYLVDIMDYDKLKVIGEKAFAVAEGESITIEESFTKVKFRPESGFKALENITAELQNKGLNRENLNKEQALFLCVENKASKGFIAYINPRAYEQELLSALTAGLLHTTKRKRGW
jgi:hypothetical protein